MTLRSLPAALLVLTFFGLRPARGEGETTFPLWPGGAPGAKGDDPKLDVPTITVYRPKSDTSKGAAVVVCPGGGYGGLAVDHEGKQVADWLNGIGVTAVVLKYRLGP